MFSSKLIAFGVQLSVMSRRKGWEMMAHPMIRAVSKAVQIQFGINTKARKAVLI